MSEAIKRIPIRVKVNGRENAREVEPRQLLVEFLREDLNLTGTHVGCDTTFCGACTVLFNGAAVKACTMFAVQADGAEIQTVEGLALNDAGELHPLQKAFGDCHGLQCGYCTPGMLMSAKALLEAEPRPDEAAIRKALAGNCCRCTGYQNIIKAVLQAAGRGA